MANSIYHIYKSAMAHHIYPMLKNSVSHNDSLKMIQGVVIIGKEDDKLMPFLLDLEKKYQINTTFIGEHPQTIISHISHLLNQNHSIVFHGLHYPGIWKRLFCLSKEKLSRIGYICWGEMIAPPTKKTFLGFFKKWAIRRILNQMGFVGALSIQDMELLRIMGVSGVQHFIYPIATYSSIGLSFGDKNLAPSPTTPVVIQIAHCNDEQLRHIHWLKQLKAILPQERDYRIICPLNYGSSGSKYIEEVCKVGEALFGKQFLPYTQLLPQEEYIKIISNVHIYIFDNFKETQNGLFHIFFFLSKGTKVFLKKTDPNIKEIPSGVAFFPLELLNAETVLNFSENDLKKNIKCMLNVFDDQKLHERQITIFQKLRKSSLL